MSDKITCTYIGHATTLIRIGTTNIVTDPHFGKRTLIFSRKEALPFSPSELPNIDAILQSHTHYDHLNISSYKYISCSVPIIVPEGSERAIGQYVPNPIIELSHFADHELVDGTRITAVPSSHGSSRISHLRYRKSNAYLVRKPENAGSIFFCGDSGYGEHFAEIGNLGAIDLAILPIGSYKPRWLFRSCHMTPSEAVRAFEDLKARHMIPIHHRTFRLSLESPNDPAQWISKILEERTDLSNRIHILSPGESFEIDNNN